MRALSLALLLLLVSTLVAGKGLLDELKKGKLSSPQQRAHALQDVTEARVAEAYTECANDYATLDMANEATASGFCFKHMMHLAEKIYNEDQMAKATKLTDVEDSDKLVAKTEANELVRIIKDVVCPAKLAFEFRFEKFEDEKMKRIAEASAACWCKTMGQVAWGKLECLRELWPLFTPERDSCDWPTGGKKSKKKKKKKTYYF